MSELATITFINDAGRRYRFPFQRSQVWLVRSPAVLLESIFTGGKQMEVQISDACRRSVEDLRTSEYDLVGPEGEIILPRTWEFTIRPGWTVFIEFKRAPQQVALDEHGGQYRDIMQRLTDWEARQEERNSRWEAEKLRERRRWEEQQAAERLRLESEIQREHERWQEERRREREQWQEGRQREQERWQEGRQREQERWQEERRREREQWQEERQTERERWESYLERELDRRFAEASSTRRVGGRETPGSICGISPCLCWLSGNRYKCRLK